MKKIYKYATGDSPPLGAKYLSTVTQTKIYFPGNGDWKSCWLVWHYFLVEVSEGGDTHESD